MSDVHRLKWSLPILAMVVTIAASEHLRAQASKSAQSAKPPFSLTITAADSVVKSGSEIWADATVKNTSDHEISVFSTSDHLGNEYNADVWTDKSTLAPETRLGREINNHTTPEDERTPQIRISSRGSIPLKPGKTFTDHANVSTMYDLSQPGKYTIQFRKYDDESKTTVKSNKITVTVTANGS
jgi:hypothetical protein